MKVVLKNIEMVSWFDTDGTPHPVKFRMNEDGERVVVNIKRVIKANKERTMGFNIWCFTCQSIISNSEKIFEIRYELETCRWILYKV